MIGEPLRRYVAKNLPASRRAADKLIVDGCVSIDKEIITAPAALVQQGQKVFVNGKKLDVNNSVFQVWLYNKPRGLITTHKDPEGRQTVFSKIPQSLGRVISVGRLDINTEGLLLLTNSTKFSHYMEMPKNSFKRVYRVRVYGKVDDKMCKSMEHGVQIDGIKYGKILITKEKSQSANTWLNITISEGKNREIRKIVAHLGLKISRIIRVSYAGFKLGDIKSGELVPAPQKTLKEFVTCLE